MKEIKLNPAVQAAKDIYFAARCEKVEANNAVDRAVKLAGIAANKKSLAKANYIYAKTDHAYFLDKTEKNKDAHNAAFSVVNYWKRELAGNN